MATKVRVLTQLHLAGSIYAPNTVLELDDKQAKALEKQAHVDTTPEAVAYCTDKLNKKVIKHPAVAEAKEEKAPPADGDQKPAT